MKDIFIDNNCVKHFRNPVSRVYKDFHKWLMEEGALAVSQKLLVEYNEGLAHYNDQGILTIIDHLTREGRLNKITHVSLDRFSFEKHQERKLLSNRRDRDHLKTILLSYRKLAISLDHNFRRDVNSYSKIDKIKPEAASNPAAINYH